MEVVVILAALLLAGLGGWPVAAAVLRLAGNVSTSNTLEREPEEAQPEASVPASWEHDATEQAGQPGEEITPVGAGSILRGGLLIGVLERLGVAVAILTGESVAIAYIVAIKGLGRYPELRETPAASERFIIGTLASLLWAVAVTVPVRIWFL